MTKPEPQTDTQPAKELVSAKLGEKEAGSQGGPKKSSGPGAHKKKPPPVAVKPTAKPARLRRHHWGVLFSFVIAVLLPLGLLAAYLWLVAEDRYTSTVGFTVRQEEGISSSNLLGNLASLTGGGSGSNGDVLYEFIRSQQIVRRIDGRLGLREYFSSRYDSDPVFALKPNATIEDLHNYWGSTVWVSYDQGTGLTELSVITFDPDMAQAIATEIVAESQELVNSLNAQSRLDAIRYANLELDQAQERVKNARTALTEFRTRTQIVDLQSDIQARMGVVSNLQQRLAAELIEFDELSANISVDDPRYIQRQRTIRVIGDRIAEERNKFANTQMLSTGEDYPTLIAEFEGLSVEREFAEAAFKAALANRDAAQANAARQSEYLATYVSPTLAESADHPQRITLFALATLFACLGWGIVVLVYYSIRDKS